MQITDQKLVYDGHFKLRLLSLQDGDDQLKRERFEPGRSVAALVLDTAQQRYLFVRQYRIGPEQEILEIPAGMLDPGESAETAIRRELQEELGYDVDRLEPLAEFYASPGTSAELMSVFYAEVSHQSGAGGGLASEGEKLDVVPLTWEEMLAQRFLDAKTFAAVQWAQLRRK
ncbi:NUDIX hydrolase [Hymenobacter guriensis]|uniref:GDP-mannose pyrophosphatase n=1 Tax=Hymenobacter guriensis TaxID=2793065 RepID=A0ABS0L2Z4_9BACT|nr:NUDIX hydrolase [Hymenobacter guriensis]MBG8553948.1 NUDIX hydrolase [Hymenobacter guriensis]